MAIDVIQQNNTFYYNGRVCTVDHKGIVKYLDGSYPTKDGHYINRDINPVSHDGTRIHITSERVINRHNCGDFEG